MARPAGKPHPWGNLLPAPDRWAITPPASHSWADCPLSWPLRGQSTTCQLCFLFPLVLGSLEEDTHTSICGVTRIVSAVCKMALFWPLVDFSGSWHNLYIYVDDQSPQPYSWVPLCPGPSWPSSGGALCLQVIYDTSYATLFFMPCPPARLLQTWNGGIGGYSGLQILQLFFLSF